MPLSHRLRLPAASVAVAVTGALLPVALLPGTDAAAAPALIAAAAPAVIGAAAASTSGAATGQLTAVLTLAQTPAQRALVRGLSRHTVRPRPGLLRAALPSDAERAAVTRWAQAHGFRVLDASGFVVEVAGPAQALASALGTHVAPARYEGGTYLAKTAAAAVPAGLRSAVASVAGLDSRPVFHPHLQVGPPEVRAIGDEVDQSASAGQGVTVGTLQLHPWTASDVSTWAAHPRGPQSNADALPDPIASGQVTPVQVNGAPVVDPKTDRGGEEVALDVEALLASAPAARQRVYFTTNDSAGMIAALNQMTQDAIAGTLQVASTSWGGCETPGAGNDFKAVGDAIDKLVAAGATFFAASGDSGAFDCGDGNLAVDFPASYPATVAVGGVHASSGSGTPLSWSYAAWGPASVRDANPTSLNGGGGGYSSFFSRPAYQAGASGDARRAVPDIAGLADPSSGMVAYITHQASDGTWKSEYVLGGGTSLAAPLAAGALAGVLAARSHTATGVGDIHQALYANPAGFQPVGGGTNGYYSAGACFNPATGLGVPDWKLLAAAVTGPSVLSTTACTASATVPLRYTGDATVADSFVAYDETAGPAPACTGGSPTPPTSITLGSAPGMHRVALLAHLRATGACATYEASTFLETAAPVVRPLSVSYLEGAAPRFAVRYAADLPAGSSGLAHYDVTIHDDSTGRDVVHDTSPQDGGVLAADPGHRYTVTVRAVSNAGLTSDAARAAFQAPWDDTQLTRRGFRSVRAGQAYNGSYSVAAARGARIGLSFTGTRAQVGFTTGPRMGTVDVFLDGRKVRTVDTYARRTGFRQRLVTVGARSGRHSLLLVVTGKHSRRSRGNAVGVDLVATG